MDEPVMASSAHSVIVYDYILHPPQAAPVFETDNCTNQSAMKALTVHSWSMTAGKLRALP